MAIAVAIVVSIFIITAGVVGVYFINQFKKGVTQPINTVTLSIKDVASETVKTAGGVTIKFSDDLKAVAEKCVSAGEGVLNNVISLVREWKTPQQLNAQIHSGAISFEPKLVVMEARILIQAEYKGHFDRWGVFLRNPIHTHMLYPVKAQLFIRLRDVKFKPFPDAPGERLILSVPDIEVDFSETGLTEAKISLDFDCTNHVNHKQVQTIKEKCWEAIRGNIPTSRDVSQLKSIARRAAIPIIDSLLVKNRIMQPVDIFIEDKTGKVVEDLSRNAELNNELKLYKLKDDDIKLLKE